MYDMDLYGAIKAVLEDGKKVIAESMPKGIYWFLKEGTIYRNCINDTVEYIVADLTLRSKDKFAILEEPKPLLSDEIFEDTVGIEVIPVKDLVPVLKELKNMIFYSLGSTALFSKKVDNLLGEKLVKKLGECE